MSEQQQSSSLINILKRNKSIHGKTESEHRNSIDRPASPGSHNSSGRRFSTVFLKKKESIFGKITELHIATLKTQKYIFYEGEVVKVMDTSQEDLGYVLVRKYVDGRSKVSILIPKHCIQIGGLTKEEVKSRKKKSLGRRSGSGSNWLHFYTKEEACEYILKKVVFFKTKKLLQRWMQQPDFKNQRRRLELLKEFYQTERSYIQALQVVIEKFMKPIQKRQLLEQDHFDLVFGCLEQIYAANQTFYTEIEQEMNTFPASDNFGKLFVKFFPFLKIYNVYVNEYDKALQLLDSLKDKSKSFKTFLQNVDSLDPLESLLIAPVQRIPRYKLFLTEIVACTSEDHYDFQNLKVALKLVSQVAIEVNERKRQSDIASFLQPLVQIFYDKIYVLETGRKFISSASVYIDLLELSSGKVITYQCEMMGFLFNDLIILCPPSLLLKPRLLNEEDIVCMIPLQACAFLLQVLHHQMQNLFGDWKEEMNPLFETSSRIVDPQQEILLEFLQSGKQFAASIKFESKPKFVEWNDYLQQIINPHYYNTIVTSFWQRQDSINTLALVESKCKLYARNNKNAKEQLQQQKSKVVDTKIRILELQQQLEVYEMEYRELEKQQEAVNEILQKSKQEFDSLRQENQQTDDDILDQVFQSRANLFQLAFARKPIQLQQQIE